MSRLMVRARSKDLKRELLRVGVMQVDPSGKIQRDVTVRSPLFDRDRVVIAELESWDDRAWRKDWGFPQLRWEGTITDALARLTSVPSAPAGEGWQYRAHGQDYWRRFWRGLNPDLAQERFSAEDEQDELGKRITHEFDRLGITYGLGREEPGNVWFGVDPPGGSGPWMAMISRVPITRDPPLGRRGRTWRGTVERCLQQLERLPDGAGVERLWSSLPDTDAS